MSYKDWLPQTPMEGMTISPDQSSEGFKSPLDGQWYWSAILPKQVDYILGWDSPANQLYFFGWVTPVPSNSWAFTHEGMVYSYLGERPWSVVVWSHLKQNGRREVELRGRDDGVWHRRMNEFWSWRYGDRKNVGSLDSFWSEFKMWEFGEQIHE